MLSCDFIHDFNFVFFSQHSFYFFFNDYFLFLLCACIIHNLFVTFLFIYILFQFLHLNLQFCEDRVVIGNVTLLQHRPIVDLDRHFCNLQNAIIVADIFARNLVSIHRTTFVCVFKTFNRLVARVHIAHEKAYINVLGVHDFLNFFPRELELLITELLAFHKRFGVDVGHQEVVENGNINSAPLFAGERKRRIVRDGVLCQHRQPVSGFVFKDCRVNGEVLDSILELLDELARDLLETDTSGSRLVDERRNLVGVCSVQIIIAVERENRDLIGRLIVLRGCDWLKIVVFDLRVVAFLAVCLLKFNPSRWAKWWNRMSQTEFWNKSLINYLFSACSSAFSSGTFAIETNFVNPREWYF